MEKFGNSVLPIFYFTISIILGIIHHVVNWQGKCQTSIVRRFDSAWALSGPIEKCNLTFQLWWLLAESTRHANFLVYENLREMSAYWNLMNKFFTITTEGTAFLPNCWLKHPITCLIPLCIYLQTTWWLSSIISSLSVRNVCCLFRPVRLVVLQIPVFVFIAMSSVHKETKFLLNMQMVVVWLMKIGYYNYKFYLTFNLMMQDWEESCIIAWFGIGTAEICRMFFNCFYHHRNINN